MPSTATLTSDAVEILVNDARRTVAVGTSLLRLLDEMALAARPGVAVAVNPLYVSIFFFIALYSVGETLWSPRLYEYSAAIAPKGQAASYMALSMLPMFIAKFFVGGSSGWLLAKFCPETGPRHPEIMWLIIGCIALVTPLGTFVFRKHLQVHEDGR